MNFLDKYNSIWNGNFNTGNETIESLVKSLSKDNLIEISPAAHYLLDYRNKEYKFISKSVVNLLGFTAEELMKGGVEMQFKLMHPDDAKIHLDFSLNRFKKFLNKIPKEEIFRYKFSYNYRMKRKDNQYFHMLQEFVILEISDDYLPIYNFGYATDISNHKRDNKISFKVSIFSNENGFEELKEDFYPGHVLTSREVEIVKLANEGLSTREIAEKLYNSFETIKTHRKNIMSKLAFSKFQMVINYCKESGLI